MAALDGKITIERGLRPCIVNLSKIAKDRYGKGQIIGEKNGTCKVLFHCWHPVTGNALVEYEDGTIHEAEPTQIQFVDNAMSEYVFPEMEES